MHVGHGSEPTTRCHQEHYPHAHKFDLPRNETPSEDRKLLAPLTNLETLHIHQYRGFILCLPSLPKLRELALLENLIECEIRFGELTKHVTLSGILYSPKKISKIL
jgi:hypothetical protein